MKKRNGRRARVRLCAEPRCRTLTTYELCHLHRAIESAMQVMRGLLEGQGERLNGENAVGLKTLKPRVAMAPSRLPSQPHQHGSVGKRITGRPLQRLRMRVLSEEPLCRVCSTHGRIAAAVHVDHIVPLSKGGTYARENLQGICIPCHKAKSLEERKGGGAYETFPRR